VGRARWVRFAVAGGGAVVAAATAGLIAERRIVKSRRAGSAGADRLGGLTGDERTVVTDDGVRLHAEVDEVAPYAEGNRRQGSDAEPTIVFVHGYALSLDCWHFQREYFRGKHRMVFYDQRSHGRSGRSDREHATIDQLGHDLARVIGELVPEGPVVLVGHSMGGMSIMAFAEHHRDVFDERVAGVALISTTAGGMRTHRLLSPFLPDAVGSQIGPRVVAGLALAPELVDRARRRGSNIGFVVAEQFAFGDEVPASYVEFVDNMLGQTSFEVLASFFPNFDSLDKFTVLDAFAGIPTYIVVGTKDLLTSVGHSRKMAKLMPEATLVECPGAGHMVILERKDKVNATLDELFATALDRQESQVS
jgi:pimeloyl-ACP methyl ester carboxylesterase